MGGTSPGQIASAVDNAVGAAARLRGLAHAPEAGPETLLHAADFAQLRLQLPVVARHGVRLHNTYSEQAETRELAPEEATRSIEGITHDYLLRTPIADRLDAREELESTKVYDPFFGTATSANNFFREIGATLGDAVQDRIVGPRIETGRQARERGGIVDPQRHALGVLGEPRVALAASSASERASRRFTGAADCPMFRAATSTCFYK